MPLSNRQAVMQFNTLVDAIDARLPNPSFTRPHGSLLIMVGLPGAGKSSIVEQMAAWCDFVVIQTDGIRKQLDSTPAYSAGEMASIYDICYALIADGCGWGNGLSSMHPTICRRGDSGR